MRLKEVKETLWMCNVHVLCFMYESTDPLEWVPIGCGMWKWFCGIHIDLNLKQVLYCFFLTNTISTRLRLHPMHICILNLFWFYGSLLSLSYIMALADLLKFWTCQKKDKKQKCATPWSVGFAADKTGITFKLDMFNNIRVDTFPSSGPTFYNFGKKELKHTLTFLEPCEKQDQCTNET